MPRTQQIANKSLKIFIILFYFLKKKTLLRCYWTLSQLCCCLWASLTAGLHGPPKGKAKKSDGFWHCAGSPKILAHLTSQRGDAGEGKRAVEKKKKERQKERKSSSNKTRWKRGKTSRGLQIIEVMRFHLLRRLQRRVADYHHYHLVLLLATHNNKQCKPSCTKHGLSSITHTQTHIHTGILWYYIFLAVVASRKIKIKKLKTSL